MPRCSLIINMTPRIPDADYLYQVVLEDNRRRAAGEEDPDAFDVCETVRQRMKAGGRLPGPEPADYRRELRSQALHFARKIDLDGGTPEDALILARVYLELDRLQSAAPT